LYDAIFYWDVASCTHVTARSFQAALKRELERERSVSARMPELEKAAEEARNQVRN
jgi:uncharacterized protein Yka (UPF0111/DUF47 family)